MRRKREGSDMPGKIVMMSAVVALSLVTWGGRLFADEPRPCSDDIARFCKEVIPGGGRIISCLKGNEDKLSHDCREKLQEVQKRIDEAKEACAADIERLCRGVEPGGGRIAGCLEKNASEISAGCAERLDLLKTGLREGSSSGSKGGDREKRDY